MRGLWQADRWIGLVCFMVAWTGLGVSSANARVGREVARPARSLGLMVRTRPGKSGPSRPSALRSGPQALTAGPPFTECPAVGADTDCGILIDVTNGGQAVLADSGQRPYKTG